MVNIYVILTVPDAQNVFRHQKEDVAEFMTFFTQPLELRQQKICKLCTRLVCFRPCPLRAFTEISRITNVSTIAPGALRFTGEKHRIIYSNKPRAQFSNPWTILKPSHIELYYHLKITGYLFSASEYIGLEKPVELISAFICFITLFR